MKEVYYLSPENGADERVKLKVGPRGGAFPYKACTLFLFQLEILQNNLLL